MGIGAYRHQVTLEHPSVVPDPAIWDCSLQSAASQVIDGLSAFFVRGRFHPGITLETQINFEGRTFQVQSVTDVDERHVELQLMCVEVVGRGSAPVVGEPVAPPTITTPPQGASITSGASVTLTVIAAGTLPLRYQWTKAGIDLPGATNAFFVTGPLTVTTTYAVRVSNAYGSVTSSPVIVTVSAVALPYQQQVLADGAIAYWPLDDLVGMTTARDLAGTRHAAISGAVTLQQPGLGGSKCMDFPSDGLAKLLPPTFPSLGSAFTLEVWVKPSAPIATRRSLVNQPITGDGDFQWYAGGSTNQLVFYYFSGSAQIYNTAANLTLGAWWHVVLTGGSGQVTLFLNGVGQPPMAITLAGAGAGPVPAIGGSTEVGAESWGWRSTMQDFAVYPRALTPTEILAHYTLRTSTMVADG